MFIRKSFCSWITQLLTISALSLTISALSFALASESVAQEDAPEASTQQVQQDANAPAGWDHKINAAFEPVADLWEKFIFTTIPIGGGKSAPIVLLLLVFGAAFFTLAFGFINIRLMPFAISVVSGKYDKIEKAGAANVVPNVNEVDGDLVDTIRDEGESGEVSHFQALATAVSGTVGLGNISGVAVAIATGGPGATFWM
ncbi:MAG: sodium:alanine symporter family protein, partial [Planctomycetales bacterium]|nr:sodium:alanine symporter family protein [Planctomycetales bacterium]